MMMMMLIIIIIFTIIIVFIIIIIMLSLSSLSMFIRKEHFSEIIWMWITDSEPTSLL